MNLRRMVMLAGAIVLLVGVIALLVPVSVPGPQGNIGCGNAVASDLSQAQSVDNGNVANLPVLNEIIPHKDFVAECQSALSSRRSWSIPVAVVGVLVLAGSFFVGGRSGRVRT
ncbi:aminopeptidase [Mycolicibacterium sp. 018/SC-01/001]|uniref:aminopeptidase n=1 Tax=Mycolicibacterium sp. 018/SC-01/001 TaxID=2592069 RepID=UPI001180C423|nr:aminopeptidase [Mycolicibacterium sp. 018/SC-01/001]TRW88973.1 aminopeptidase [Mycolicibacterium sp. 018/SC-01/001]